MMNRLLACAALAVSAVHAHLNSAVTKALLSQGESVGMGSVWGYDCKDEEELCPPKWGELDIPGNQCGSTKRQTPINLPLKWQAEHDGVSNLTLALDYASWKEIDLVNNGHTVQVNVPAGVTNHLYLTTEKGIKLTYQLAQFHFHTLSEHSVDGFHYPLEVHFVHTLVADANSAEVANVEPYVVLGMFFADGPDNQFLELLMQESLPKMPESHSAPANTLVVPSPLNINSFLSHTNLNNFYTYRGSLTTPPCTEAVHWFVLTDPLTVSKQQLQELDAVLPLCANARPIQQRGSEINLNVHFA